MKISIELLAAISALNIIYGQVIYIIHHRIEF